MAQQRGGSSSRDRRKKTKIQRKKPLNQYLNQLKWIDYKDVQFLRRFVNDKNKIVAKRSTGANSKIQRLVAKAIKNAREMGLLPFCTSR
jgi:small subunit ribosomal protein S18